MLKRNLLGRGEIVVSIDAQKMVIETMECSTLTLSSMTIWWTWTESDHSQKRAEALFGQTRRRLETMIQSLMDRRSIVSVFCLLDGNEPLKRAARSGHAQGLLEAA